MFKLLILTLLITLDQITKHLPFWSKSCNPYISWSIPLRGVFLWLFIVLALGFLIYYFKKTNFPYSLLLITAGAVSNIIDRLHLGCVIDFISIIFPFSIPFIGHTFPVFNLADTFITIGVIIFIWQEIKNTK